MGGGGVVKWERISLFTCVHSFINCLRAHVFSCTNAPILVVKCAKLSLASLGEDCVVLYMIFPVAHKHIICTINMTSDRPMFSKAAGKLHDGPLKLRLID